VLPGANIAIPATLLFLLYQVVLMDALFALMLHSSHASCPQAVIEKRRFSGAL
jgi:hypothetical protein